MINASNVLRAVAEELAKQAKESMPELMDGERIQQEWLKDGVYSRETVHNSEIILSQYDFRCRVFRRMVKNERGEWQSLKWFILLKSWCALEP